MLQGGGVPPTSSVERPLGSIRAALASVRPVVSLTMALLVAHPTRAIAQSYYNLEPGRPVRVGDALPTARGTLDLQLLPLRFERYEGGTVRWRSDTKLSLGVAPHTEIEVRVPLLAVDPRIKGMPVPMGLGGLGVGLLRALSIETGAIPAVAVSGEWVAPVGSMAAKTGSYSAGLLVTKTFPLARFHLNAGAGSWSIRATPSGNGVTCPRVAPPGTVVPPGCSLGQPTVPDTPCDRAPTAGLAFACLPGNAAVVSTASSLSGAAAVDTAALSGPRFMAGIGVDHAFALASTLVTADFVVERFVDLYDQNDFTAELGLRHQLTPQLVFDVGGSRRFGATSATAVTLGFSYEIPVKRSPRERKDDR
ncbi:MAG: hypothetical protein DMD35_02900 [Gemmatimonadetes bacterium]|nr:MAG: hypothetical protein DMD35_02900 [Gemmatimonadota bacterium]